MIFAADNINPMNPVVAQAMDALDPAPVRDLARRCAAAGASWIDINPGPLPARRRDRMRFLVDAVQEATDVRLILDSADAEVLAEGLRACRRTPVLNALTLLCLLMGAGLDVALCNILDPDLSRVRDGIRTYIGP